MREVISSYVELARKLEQLEYRLGQHHEEIASMFEAIKQLMTPIPPKKKTDWILVKVNGECIGAGKPHSAFLITHFAGSPVFRFWLVASFTTSQKANSSFPFHEKIRHRKMIESAFQ
jgi:hypothetical protein